MRRHVRNNCGSNRGEEATAELVRRAANARHEQLAEKIERQAIQIQTLQTDLQKTRAVLCGPAAANGAAATDGAVITNVITNNVVNHHTTTNNINISIFGKEDFTNVSRATIQGILDEALEKTGGCATAGAPLALHSTVKYLYGGGHSPKNVTCFTQNKREKEAMVHSEDGWNLQSMPVVMSVLAIMGINVLFNKQPTSNPDKYAELLTSIAEQESGLAANPAYQDILDGNKRIIRAILHRLPVRGED